MFPNCSTRSHVGHPSRFRRSRGLFPSAPCGNRGRVCPSPEYSDSGVKTPAVECSPSLATTYCASTGMRRKRVNAGSTQNPVDLQRRNSREQSRALTKIVDPSLTTRAQPLSGQMPAPNAGRRRTWDDRRSSAQWCWRCRRAPRRRPPMAPRARAFRQDHRRTRTGPEGQAL